MYNIFTLKAVEFEHQKENPFGFDSIADTISEKYLKFSGVIRKPIYLVFVAYIDHLIKTNQLNHSGKKINDIKIRLEKLLVTSWKRNRNLRGESVLGNSITRINPFEARDGNWIIQNCFKIYESSARKLELEKIVKYYSDQNTKEIKLLNEFINRSGHLNSNERYLSNLLLKMSKKRTSIFNGKTVLSKKIRIMFLKSLRDLLNDGLFGNDYQFISKIFNKPAKSGKEINNILNSIKYPFAAYNNWVRNFVLAVDCDLNKKDSKLAWLKTEKAYKSLDRSIKVENRPIPQCWFKYNGNKYIVDDDFNSSGWNAVLRRAKRQNGHFYDFKLTALHSLLKESARDE